MLKPDFPFDFLRKSLLIFGIFLLSICASALPADPTTTTLVSSSDTSVLSSPVILTAAVSPSTATGKVAFYSGANYLGASTLSGGVATLSTVTLPVGRFDLRAYYRGDIVHAPSNSASVLHTVQAGFSNGFSGLRSVLNGSVPAATVLADVNNDGKLDLIVGDNTSKGIDILTGDGSGNFAQNWAKVNFPYDPELTIHQIIAADINNDGNVDLISLYSSVCISSVVYHIGNGQGDFDTLVEIDSFASQIAGFTITDINNDGILDAALIDAGAGYIRIYFGTDSGFLSLSIDTQVFSAASSLATGDFNKDGNVDLVVGGINGDLNVFWGNGDGTFPGFFSQTLYTESHGLAVGDFDQNGYLDIVTSNGGGSNIKVLLNTQNGSFDVVDVVTTSPSHTPVVSDFNGDGILDISVTSYTSSSIGVLSGNGDGSFQAARDYSTFMSGQPKDMATGDLNGDGAADIVFTDQLQNRVDLFLGRSVGSMTVMVGTPQSAAVGTSFSDQFQVMVLDTDTHPVEGVYVTFSAPGTGASGTFEYSHPVLTNGCGIATASVFTANNIGGSYNVIATVQGSTLTATFSLTNTGGLVNQIEFTQQPTSTLIGTVITPAITVQLKNGSGIPQATPGVPVTLTLSSGSGPLTGTTTVNTNASGISVFSDLTIGSVGSKTLTASSPGLASVPSQSFLVVNPGGGSLTPTAGTNQSTHLGAIFPVALQVRLLDSAGMPVANTPVTYTVPHSGAGGAFTHSATVRTDINGIATAPDLVANHISGRFEVRASASGVSLPAIFTLTNLAASPESPRIAGIVNAGSFLRVISAGSLATIFGDGFSPVPLKAEGFPLPMELGGISIRVEGLPAPILYVDEKQINFQLPDLTSLGDLTSVVVTVHRKGIGNYTQVLPIRLTSPGIFLLGGTNHAVAQNQDFSLNTESNPVAPGGIVFLYATGLGPVDPPVQAGNAAPLEVLSWTKEDVTAMIGNQPAKVLFSGLTPGFAGLMQVNIQIPDQLAPGEYSVTLKVGGLISNGGVISVGKKVSE